MPGSVRVQNLDPVVSQVLDPVVSQVLDPGSRSQL